MNHKRSLSLVFIILLILGILPSYSQADLVVTYSAAEAELVLFGQPQKAPFRDVALKVFVKGPRIRLEIVDHKGKTLWQLVDRSVGTAYELNPETETYRQLAGNWSCDNLAQQTAQWGAYGLNLVGADTLVMDSPVRARVGDHPVEQCTFYIQGRFLGVPRPVEARLIISMPVDEAAVLGESGQADLYCGDRPAADEWDRAFRAQLPLGERESAELAMVTGLPLQIEISTDLGLGRARLVVSATHILQDDLDDSLFQIPDHFTQVK